jgi:hypothetical protein
MGRDKKTRYYQELHHKKQNLHNHPNRHPQMASTNEVLEFEKKYIYHGLVLLTLHSLISETTRRTTMNNLGWKENFYIVLSEQLPPADDVLSPYEDTDSSFVILD